MDNYTPAIVLDFWFKDGMESKWYFGGEEFDQLLATKYLKLHTAAKNGQLTAWENTRDGRLALVILLDQFSRNIYRAKAEAFANDQKALAIAKQALLWGDDIWFKQNKSDGWRQFLYMAFMHSENLADQRRCVELFSTHGPNFILSFAQDHLDVIARFGRFPGRNQALSRQSTPQEEAFLALGVGNWGAKAKK